MRKTFKYSIILLGLALIFYGCGTEKISSAVKGGAQKLSAHDLNKLLSGSTVKSTGYGEEAEITYLPNGNLSAKNTDGDKDTGAWRVEDKGRLCLKFRKWGQGDKICYQVYQDGNEYKQFNSSGLLAYTFTIIEQGEQFQAGITSTAPAPANSREAVKPAAVKNIPTASDIPAPPDSPADIEFIVRQSARHCPGCNLAGAQLAGADLIGADLEGANLTRADFSTALLRHANLKGANLYKANLKRADLTGADLTGANLTEADLTEANLRGAKGLK